MVDMPLVKKIIYPVFSMLVLSGVYRLMAKVFIITAVTGKGIYPRTYATRQIFRQFWTEQYLLQGLLAFNAEFKVLLGINYLMVDHATLFREAFPHYSPDLHPFNSGSFWIRRRLDGKRCE